MMLAQDFELKLTACEDMWFTSFSKTSKEKFLVRVVYRHSTQNHLKNKFVETFNDILQEINTAKLKAFIVGNFNINTLTNSLDFSIISKNYLNSITSNGYSSLVDIPTRSYSQKLLDHILSNETNCRLLSGVIEVDHIFDHYPTFVIASGMVKNSNKTKFHYYRSMKNFDTEKFCDDAFNSLALYYYTPFSCDNFNHVFEKFSNEFKTVINNHAPTKRLCRRQRKLAAKPWITKGILTSIRNKQRLYKTYLKNGNANQQLYYKRYANKLTKIKKLSGKLYY